MILIVSHLADEHAKAVIRVLESRNANVLLFDTSQFPKNLKVNISHETGSPGKYLVNTNDFSSVNAVWWRRPQSFRLEDDIQVAEDRNFAFGECQAAISGLYSCLDANWINNPERDEIAARKVFQLKIAAGLGFKIPKTLITNDPAEALTFIDRQGERGTIYKAFSATEKSWRETRLLKQEERSQIEAVQYAPVIFQEHIKADIDLRITVINQSVFAAEILSGNTSYKVDFRMTMHEAEIRSHTLPDDLEKKIISFVKKLGLIYGAIDMRLTPSGEYVFLEINPAGQWLFIEERTGQPITQTLAEQLLAYDTK